MCDVGELSCGRCRQRVFTSSACAPVRSLFVQGGGISALGGFDNQFIESCCTDKQVVCVRSERESWEERCALTPAGLSAFLGL